MHREGLFNRGAAAVRGGVSSHRQGGGQGGRQGGGQGGGQREPVQGSVVGTLAGDVNATEYFSLKQPDAITYLVPLTPPPLILSSLNQPILFLIGHAT